MPLAEVMSTRITINSLTLGKSLSLSKDHCNMKCTCLTLILNRLKPLILFSLFGVIYISSLCAQDTITLKNGEEIEAKVLEITPDIIKYKKFNNLDGPTISILKSEVFMIKYENGTKDVFGVEDKEPIKTPDVEYKKIDIKDKSESTTVTYSKVEYDRPEFDREVYHLLKVNPLLVFSGDIPIYYERRLSDHLAAEAGIGITHMDYLYEGFDFEQSFEGFNIDRTASIGYSFRAEIKYYPSKSTKALDEMYFGFAFRIKHYNTDLIKCNSTLISPSVSETRTYIDNQLTGGYIYYISDMVFLDFYGGIGIRNRNTNRGSCNFNGPITVITEPTLVQSVAPAIALGVKLGFAF